MTENVKPFPNTDNSKAANAQPQKDVIESLRTLLEQAENGNVQGFAYAIASSNGDAIINWAGSNAPGVSRLLLYKAVGLLFHAYNTASLAQYQKSLADR